MKNRKITREERDMARRLAQNETWVSHGQYQQDEEYLACVQDILDHEVFQSMDRYVQHGKTTCKEHCIKVSYLSYRLCRRMGWDEAAKPAARGGLLHDLFLYDWHTHAKNTGEHFHGFTHPRTALHNAESSFVLTSEEKNVILRHMWPLTIIPPNSRAGFAVVYADKFCTSAEVAAGVKNWILDKAGIRHDVLGRIT